MVPFGRQQEVLRDLSTSSPEDLSETAGRLFIDDGVVVISKYPPAEPEALRLLAPQRGLFATVESKSKNNSKNAKCKNQGILPELSNFYCLPGRAGGSLEWTSQSTI